MPALLIEAQRVAHTVAHGTPWPPPRRTGRDLLAVPSFRPERLPRGHRLAALGELRPSLRARARMGGGAHGLALGRSLALDAVPLAPRRGLPRKAAPWCSRLRLPSFSPAAASASASLADRPSPAAPPRAASPRSSMGDTSEGRACRRNGKTQPLLRVPSVQRFPRAGRGDRRADRGDRGARRARPSHPDPRSGRRDASLRGPHRIRRERRPRPRDRRPRRDLARALSGAAHSATATHLAAEAKRSAGRSWSITPTGRPRRSVLAIHNRLAGLERDYRYRPPVDARCRCRRAGRQP